MRSVKKLLVVGCGRSGTRYASKVLRLAGLDVGHERDGRHGRVDWRCVADPSAAGRYGLVLHQVRHPLRVIESFHTAGKVSWGLIAKADPDIVVGPLLRDCVRYWVRWNQAAERMAARTYRVEDMASELPSILAACGMGPGADLSKALSVCTSDHTRRGHPKHGARLPSITMADVMSDAGDDVVPLLRLARRYGYELS